MTAKQEGHRCASPSSLAEAGQRALGGVFVIFSPEYTADAAFPPSWQGDGTAARQRAARCGEPGDVGRRGRPFVKATRRAC